MDSASQKSEWMPKLAAHALENGITGLSLRPLARAAGTSDRMLIYHFGNKERLLVIHNMGQACRYCTLWADGFNGLLPHLEAAMSVVLVSKDAPAVQREFATSRGWRFRLASHQGGAYIVEQTVMPGGDNMPGAVVYERDGDQVLRKGAGIFGPNDRFCALWSLLGLAGLGLIVRRRR